MSRTAFRTQVEGFLRDECGAVTIDWIVLTAGVAFLAIFIIASFVPANHGVAHRISSAIDTVETGPATP
jgi:Flp pilus assembly pilin Flp